MNDTTPAIEVYLKAIKRLKDYVQNEPDEAKADAAQKQIDRYYAQIEDDLWIGLTNRTAALTQLTTDLRQLITKSKSPRTPGTLLKDLESFTTLVSSIINPAIAPIHA